MIPGYLSPFANHLWQSTLFTGAALLLTLVLRQNRAHIRYRLWLAASTAPYGHGSEIHFRTATVRERCFWSASFSEPAYCSRK